MKRTDQVFVSHLYSNGRFAPHHFSGPVVVAMTAIAKQTTPILIDTWAFKGLSKPCPNWYDLLLCLSKFPQIHIFIVAALSLMLLLYTLDHFTINKSKVGAISVPLQRLTPTECISLIIQAELWKWRRNVTEQQGIFGMLVILQAHCLISL